MSHQDSRARVCAEPSTSPPPLVRDSPRTYSPPQRRDGNGSEERDVKSQRAAGTDLPTAAELFVPSLPGIPNLATHPTYVPFPYFPYPFFKPLSLGGQIVRSDRRDL
ncbi:hypothetical protein L198_02900 [Cryptococcus wingfieldii CBS 7118]|uniref:Uncharacterized protein n=1 Tax=Cryptococcus wingfieldii CBS 7118 TaxID=1295528 RepID=A0A1E3JI86_9TREE|nr:hypothetical protein L198_02900 [Cryptococcus wingfieldii CBS 7118]ODO00580.1 hypothetical protein L198_02900 [Cryptococcus wingfieldii CBS 7118]